jgi:D-beta-D-heptose 7-phosphate kinase/D-beta-D-heptose 1-phosphate adenosyltransferase
MKKLVLVTGGFDPLHSGHIVYFEEAKKLGDILVVGVNSDAWLTRKKGRSFMPFDERMNIVKNIQGVDFIIEFNDDDGSAKHAIKLARQTWPEYQIIFANGGDRTNTNIPEMDLDVENIEFVFGVGGENKMNSSSWILQEWKAPKTERQWGYYRVLHENNKEVKLKELTVLPSERLSMQRHKDRAEHWFVAEGIATVYTVNQSTDVELLGEFKKFDHVHINKTQWHQLCNETDQPLKIVEIQYGERCEEEDIERK